jgi:hypothetical protein
MEKTITMNNARRAITALLPHLPKARKEIYER